MSEIAYIVFVALVQLLAVVCWARSSRTERRLCAARSRIGMLAGPAQEYSRNTRLLAENACVRQFVAWCGDCGTYLGIDGTQPPVRRTCVVCSMRNRDSLG